MSQTDHFTVDGAGALRDALITQLGLKDYADILERYGKSNFAKDSEFQTCFNRLYRIRWGEDWRKNFYTVFADKELAAIQEKRPISFEEILRDISTDFRVAASFASKMLATIDPDMPIWDSHVLHHLGLTLGGKGKEDRLSNAVSLYDKIVLWYRKYMVTDDAKCNIELFNRYLPDYAWISDVKKIDYMLWADENKES